MKQFNYKCTVAKNGTKMYYQKVGGKWKRISGVVGKNAEKGKKKYNNFLPIMINSAMDINDSMKMNKLSKYEQIIIRKGAIKNKIRPIDYLNSRIFLEKNNEFMARSKNQGKTVMDYFNDNDPIDNYRSYQRLSGKNITPKNVSKNILRDYKKI